MCGRSESFHLSTGLTSRPQEECMAKKIKKPNPKPARTRLQVPAPEQAQAPQQSSARVPKVITIEAGEVDLTVGTGLLASENQSLGTAVKFVIDREKEDSTRLARAKLKVKDQRRSWK